MPGVPAHARWWRLSARCVWRIPEAPKSFAWLLATFMISNPARFRLRAYDGGAWKAKQVPEVEPAHFDTLPRERVSSRLPQVKSPLRRLGLTARSESRPPFGGVP